MTCTNPVYIAHPDNSLEARSKRIREGKNDIQGGYYVPCGKCYACLSNRRQDWAFRLKLEALASDTVDTLFLTLTHDDVYDEKCNHIVSKKELQNLFKSLRKSGCMFKYYAIGEYGPHTHRGHYHAIIFLKGKDGMVTDRVQFINNLKYYWQIFDEKKNPIRTKGFIEVGSVEPASINYVLHYHVRPKETPADIDEVAYYDTKKKKVAQVGKPFAIQSQGLGVEFISNPRLLEVLRNSDDMLVHDAYGNTGRLPRYYRKKFGITKLGESYEMGNPFVGLPKKYQEDYNYLFSYRDMMSRKFKKYNVQEKF